MSALYQRQSGSRTKSMESMSGGRRLSRADRFSSVASAKDAEIMLGKLAGEGNSTTDDKKDNRKLAIVFIAMVFVGLGNKIFQKLMTIPMHNYPNFLNLLTTFIYLPTSFAYIIPMVRNGGIPREQAEMSKKPFFVMGFLDAIAGIMQVFAATYLPGPLLILLSQAAIPMSMIITRYLLKQNYSLFQYVGAVVVAGGIACVLAPTISGSGSLLWAVMMILSTVPMALSSVYKEIALGETQLDPIFLNGWICVFQFIFSILMAVPASLASSPPVPVQDLPENIWDGLLCFGGTNSVECPGVDDETVCSPDNCAVWAPVFVTIYLIFNQAYNLLIILIIKYGSSNLLFMALTIMVPLGNFAFTLPFVPGHAPLKVTDVIGLVIICSGLGFYRFMDGYLKTYHNGMFMGYKVVLDDDADGVDEEDLEGAISGGGGLHVGGHIGHNLSGAGIDKNPLLDKKFLDDADVDHSSFAILEGESIGGSPPSAAGSLQTRGLGTYGGPDTASNATTADTEESRYSVSKVAQQNSKNKNKNKKKNKNKNKNGSDSDDGSERGLSLHETGAMS